MAQLKVIFILVMLSTCPKYIWAQKISTVSSATLDFIIPAKLSLPTNTKTYNIVTTVADSSFGNIATRIFDEPDYDNLEHLARDRATADVTFNIHLGEFEVVDHGVVEVVNKVKVETTNEEDGLSLEIAEYRYDTAVEYQIRYRMPATMEVIDFGGKQIRNHQPRTQEVVLFAEPWEGLTNNPTDKYLAAYLEDHKNDIVLSINFDLRGVFADYTPTSIPWSSAMVLPESKKSNFTEYSVVVKEAIDAMNEYVKNRNYEVLEGQMQKSLEYFIAAEVQTWDKKERKLPAIFGLNIAHCYLWLNDLDKAEESLVRPKLTWVSLYNLHNEVKGMIDYRRKNAGQLATAPTFASNTETNNEIIPETLPGTWKSIAANLGISDSKVVYEQLSGDKVLLAGSIDNELSGTNFIAIKVDRAEVDGIDVSNVMAGQYFAFKFRNVSDLSVEIGIAESSAKVMSKEEVIAFTQSNQEPTYINYQKQ